VELKLKIFGWCLSTMVSNFGVENFFDWPKSDLKIILTLTMTANFIFLKKNS
jgi:hypothetical protein